MKCGDSIFAVLFLLAVFYIFSVMPENGPSGPIPGTLRVKRVVSLSPSLSRAIVDMGGADMVVAATRPHFIPGDRVKNAGEFISPDWELIARERPDLVLLSADEGTIQNTEILEYMGLPSYRMPSCGDFTTLCEQYRILSVLLGLERDAMSRLDDFYRFHREMTMDLSERRAGPRVVFLVSTEPFVAVCAKSHLDSVLKDAGAINVFTRIRRSYSIISAESLIAARPEMIIVMRQETDCVDRCERAARDRLEFTGARVTFIGSDNAPYTTPGDYVSTLGQVRTILANHGGMM